MKLFTLQPWDPRFHRNSYLQAVRDVRYITARTRVSKMMVILLVNMCTEALKPVFDGYKNLTAAESIFLMYLVINTRYVVTGQRFPFFFSVLVPI